MKFLETYELIREWKDQNIFNFLNDTASLNNFHDQVMRKVLAIALKKMDASAPPCHFAWFITGSGGRMEQGIISDQDHGIVYETSNEANDTYFRLLGEEISYGLFVVGYPYCQGNIMTSNAIWCKPLKDWLLQVQAWMENESWECIRYLQIFYDARTLFGENDYIIQLKTLIYHYQLQNPILLHRFSENVKHFKTVIGPFGQILVEQHGIHQGSLNLKYAAFLPYVNAIRLLSIKEGVFETSTLDRINRLMILHDYAPLLQNCEHNFQLLLMYRLSFSKSDTYSETHYLNLELLTKEQKKQLKQILKEGKRIHDGVMSLTLLSK